MQITIFSNFSKEDNSTKQPSGGTSVTCTLKQDCSVIHPVFILDTAGLDTNYVQWGNRYYFVDDVISIRNSTVELHCTVDPMATWKTQIGASSQYVTRSASQKDTYCVDGMYPVQNKSSVTLTNLSSINFIDQSGSYVVGVISDSGSGVEFYNMLPATFSQFMGVLFGGSWLDAPITELSLELQKELVNPFQYITSVQWFPFLIGGSSKSVKFGYWDSGVIAEAIGESVRNKHYVKEFTLPTHPQVARGLYMNGSPFTRHDLFFYVWGSTPIDPMYFIDSQTIVITVDIDTYTGVGVLSVTNANGAYINKLTAQCGVPIQISQVTQNLIQTSTGVMGFASGLISGSMVGAMSGIMSAIEGLSPQVQTAGAQGTKAGYSFAPYIRSTFYYCVNDDNTRNGRPLMQNKTINTLSGFIQVENPDVDIPATTEERTKIVEYMKTGFYYE